MSGPSIEHRVPGQILKGRTKILRTRRPIGEFSNHDGRKSARPRPAPKRTDRQVPNLPKERPTVCCPENGLRTMRNYPVVPESVKRESRRQEDGRKLKRPSELTSGAHAKKQKAAPDKLTGIISEGKNTFDVFAGEMKRTDRRGVMVQ